MYENWEREFDLNSFFMATGAYYEHESVNCFYIIKPGFSAQFFVYVRTGKNKTLFCIFVKTYCLRSQTKT